MAGRRTADTVVSKKVCSSSWWACMFKAKRVGRDTPMVRLRSVTKPYSCVCTSIWLAHCTRCAGVLGCVRPMGSSLVCWWMRHINHTCQGYFVQLVELNCKPRLAPIETCLSDQFIPQVDKT